MSVEREQRERGRGQKEERAGRRDEKGSRRELRPRKSGVRSSGEGAGQERRGQQEVPLGAKLTYFSWGDLCRQSYCGDSPGAR